MSYYDLPDDWGSYYRTCSDCGERYHASGVTECACDWCEDHGERIPPGSEYCELCPRCISCGEQAPLAGAGWCPECMSQPLEELRAVNPPTCGHGADCAGWSAILGRCMYPPSPAYDPIPSSVRAAIKVLEAAVARAGLEIAPVLLHTEEVLAEGQDLGANRFWPRLGAAQIVGPAPQE